nr:hypothetical protein [Candidatus Microthrix sp.]
MRGGTEWNEYTTQPGQTGADQPATTIARVDAARQHGGVVGA